MLTLNIGDFSGDDTTIFAVCRVLRSNDDCKILGSLSTVVRAELLQTELWKNGLVGWRRYTMQKILAGVSLSHNPASNKLTQLSSLLLTIKENKGCIRQCNVSCKLPRNTILTQVLNETLHSVTYFITAKILSCGGRCRAESDEVLLFEQLVPR